MNSPEPVSNRKYITVSAFKTAIGLLLFNLLVNRLQIMERHLGLKERCDSSFNSRLVGPQLLSEVASRIKFSQYAYLSNNDILGNRLSLFSSFFISNIAVNIPPSLPERSFNTCSYLSMYINVMDAYPSEI